MIKIELIGSYTAFAPEYGITVSYEHSKRPKDPLGPLCRQLITRGVDPETLTNVVRGETQVFYPVSVGHWAKYDYVDGETRSAYRRKYVASPYRGDQKSTSS